MVVCWHVILSPKEENNPSSEVAQTCLSKMRPSAARLLNILVPVKRYVSTQENINIHLLRSQRAAQLTMPSRSVLTLNKLVLTSM